MGAQAPFLLFRGENDLKRIEHKAQRIKMESKRKQKFLFDDYSYY